MKRLFKEYFLHISVLIIGAIVFAGGCFQNSLWFDDAYTVGLVSNDFFDVIKWATFDVHPHLYYVMLKLFTMVFGNSLPVMRLFSAIGAILFASLGLTHIRRDFGKEIGFWFSFVAVFTASTLNYALQIRMYTWAAYFVMLTAIYAYRFFTQPDQKRNRVLFLVFSIAAAYTHYFGLFASAAINLVLIYETKKQKLDAKSWFKNAAIQIGAYIPGALVFLLQISLGGATWIKVEWPDLGFDLSSYHLLGDVLKVFVERTENDYINPLYSINGFFFFALYCVAGLILYYFVKKDRFTNNEIRALASSCKVYYGIIGATLIISLFRAVYYIRYTVVIQGFLFFMIALLISKLRFKPTKAIAAAFLIAVFSVQTAYYYDLMYSETSHTIEDTFDPLITAEDDFLIDDASVYVMTVMYPENTVCYYNKNDWRVEDTYCAFGRDAYVVNTLSEVKSLSDRVWTMGRGDCYEYLLENGYSEVSSYDIHLEFHNYNWEIILLKKPE